MLRSRALYTFTILAALLFALTACSTERASNSNTAPDQSQKPESNQVARDNGRKLGEKAREAEIRTRDDREKIKEGARDAAVKLKEESKVLGTKAVAAAQGIREGWSTNDSKSSSATKNDAINLNTASKSQLVAMGLSASDAQHVLANRPYRSADELLSRGIVSQATYRGIHNRIKVE